jgi:tRNA 2-thiouridine synthesizing protein A
VSGRPATAASGARELDLRGVPCPINWVRTRLALESLEPGTELVVRLDRGEPLESVPRSAREDGHEIRGGEGERLRIVRR